MKLQAQIGDNAHEVEIVEGDKVTRARVGDREYELEVSEPQTGVFLIKSAGQIFEAVSTRTGDSVAVSVRSHEFDVKVIDPKRLRGAGAESDHGSGKAEIKTAMPGKVVRILLQAGAEVQKGDGVIVVEAMKMQNEMKSPKAGVVAEVRVNEGDTVAAGDVLVVIE
jgi:biotin carboxyl carrier protein